MADGSTTIPYVAYRDGVPIGYVQSYVAMHCGDGWWPDERDPGVHGIDQFLADANNLGHGVGTEMVRVFVRDLFLDRGVTRIQTDRRDGGVVLNTKWRAMTKVAFIAWVRDRLAPRLRPGDIVVLDHLQAHKAPAVRFWIAQRGATLKHLPPYSHDFNPIEPVWGLVKKRIRDYAPRTGAALRRIARAARHAVTPYHCQQFYAHAGYGHSTENRD